MNLKHINHRYFLYLSDKLVAWIISKEFRSSEHTSLRVSEYHKPLCIFRLVIFFKDSFSTMRIVWERSMSKHTLISDHQSLVAWVSFKLKVHRVIDDVVVNFESATIFRHLPCGFVINEICFLQDFLTYRMQNKCKALPRIFVNTTKQRRVEIVVWWIENFSAKFLCQNLECFWSLVVDCKMDWAQLFLVLNRKICSRLNQKGNQVFEFVHDSIMKKRPAQTVFRINYRRFFRH